MKKRFNIYSMGQLVLKDSSFEKLLSTLKNKESVINELKRMKSDEICFFKDKRTGRQWEFERVL